MNSLARLMGAPICIPDFSCISKRAIELPRHILSKAQQPGSLVIVDSTGLKVYGKDEWQQKKHAVLARRTWRKLHLAVDGKHQFLVCELTTAEVGDPAAVPDLLDQIDTPFETFMGVGAFDGEPTSQAVLSRQPNAKFVVPPHKTAVVSSAGDTQRDEHIRDSAAHARIGMGQFVYAEHDDQPWNASVSENLKMVANRDHLNTNPINSTTPGCAACARAGTNTAVVVHRHTSRLRSNGRLSLAN